MKKSDSLYVYIITVFFVPIMLTLLFMSIVSTSYVTWAEEVFFLKDNALLNIIAALLFTLAVVLLSKVSFLRSVCEKIDENKRLFFAIKAGLLLVMLLISLFWVWNTHFTPFGDSDWLHEAAVGYSNGVYDAFKNGWYNYIDLYPFQSRTLLLYALTDSVFGGYRLMVYQTLNCIFTVVTFAALSDISGFMGAKASDSLLIILCGMLWVPTIFYNSFVYSNVPGLSLAVLSLDLWIRFFNGSKMHALILSVLCMALSFCMKSNFLIYAVAMIIYAVFKSVSGKQVKKGLIAVGALIFCIGVAFVVPGKIVSAKTGEPLDEGMATISWVEMGITESVAGPGWYTDDSKRAYQEAGFKREEHDKICRENIKERLAYFKEHKNAAVDFFIRKTASQWNEPTAESFWLLRGSEIELPEAVAKLTSYTGYVKAVTFLDMAHLLIVLGCVLYILTFKKTAKSLEALLIPMIFIGMFVFHFVWEAKSQYAFLGWEIMLAVSVLGYRGLVTFIKDLKDKKSPGSDDPGKKVCPYAVVKTCVAVLTIVAITVLSLKGYSQSLTKDNYEFAEYLNENFG